MKIQINYILPTLIALLTVMSVNQWSVFPIGNTAIYWIVSFTIIIIILFFIRDYFLPANKRDYLIILLYFAWFVIGVIRGVFVAENYWEWKQLITGTLALSLPLFVYLFYNTSVLRIVLKFWFKYTLPLFAIIVWLITPDAYHFFLGPVLLMACFIPFVDKKWKIVLLGLIILMLVSDLGARSQVIKAAIAILMSVAFYFKKYISFKLLKLVHWVLYVLPIVLMSLGFSGAFNIFKGFSEEAGKAVSKDKSIGDIKAGDISGDTRTFIYVEVISSAIKHNYYLWGRTPARGNDSATFGEFNAEDLKTGKYERHSNELCFPNIFTWLGLPGMILYCLIYLKSSYLALYKSRNIFMKLLGVYIAFRFLYGWIEDTNRFDIANLSLWMMIAMGFSAKFRMMDNNEIKRWVKSLNI